MIKLPKNPIPILNKVEVKILEEWEDENQRGQDRYIIKMLYKFDGFNGVGYYQQQLNDKSNKDFFEITTIQDRL
ncbi:hypothetical protein [Phytoplasma sp.]|uniref:hypothetical protein n=1 Tax=Phytoplasma sp. TaxID=2155 RepID=UPI002B4024C7|nr:hypothetical protein [Phytoplasma sp.]